MTQAERSDTKTPKKETGHVFQAIQYLRKLIAHPLLVLDKTHPNFNTIMAEVEQSKHPLSHAPKLVALQELLNECGIGISTKQANKQLKEEETDIASSATPLNQHRVLVFAQQKVMLDYVERDLLKKHMPTVTYMRLDGGVAASKRQEVVNRFNSDPTIDILLLTTHVGGLGLNLTGADVVIFLEHDWNPSRVWFSIL